MNEEEVIGADPYCLKCQEEIARERLCSLMMRRGFVVFHSECFLQMLDIFAPNEAQQNAKQMVN